MRVYNFCTARDETTIVLFGGRPAGNDERNRSLAQRSYMRWTVGAMFRSLTTPPYTTLRMLVLNYAVP